MNLGWTQPRMKARKGQERVKNKPDKVKLCKICGKPTAGGHLCQTCHDFIASRRIEERNGKK